MAQTGGQGGATSGTVSDPCVRRGVEVALKVNETMRAAFWHPWIQAGF